MVIYSLSVTLHPDTCEHPVTIVKHFVERESTQQLTDSAAEADLLQLTLLTDPKKVSKERLAPHQNQQTLKSFRV